MSVTDVMLNIWVKVMDSKLAPKHLEFSKHLNSLDPLLRVAFCLDDNDKIRFYSPNGSIIMPLVSEIRETDRPYVIEINPQKEEGGKRRSKSNEGVNKTGRKKRACSSGDERDEVSFSIITRGAAATKETLNLQELDRNKLAVFLGLQEIQLSYLSTSSVRELFKLNQFKRLPVKFKLSRKENVDNIVVYDEKAGDHGISFLEANKIQPSPVFCSTESGNQAIYDRYFWEPLDWYSKNVAARGMSNGIQLGHARNSSRVPTESSKCSLSVSDRSATGRTEDGNEFKPDLTAWCGQVCFIIVEEKASQSDLTKCIQQLQKNASTLSDRVYDEVPCIFNMAMAGPIVQLYIVDRQSSDNKLEIVRTFNLLEIRDRLALIACSLVMARVVHIYYEKSLFPRHTRFLKLNEIEKRGPVDVCFKLDESTGKEYFRKVVTFGDKPYFHSVEHIQKLYDYLREGRIMNTIEVKNFKIDLEEKKMTVDIASIFCESSHRIVNPNTQKTNFTMLKQALLNTAEALESLHALGLVHRDVRWGNIMYDYRTRRFVLIDFENSGPNNVLVNVAVKDYIFEIAEMKKTYTYADDMYMVGILLKNVKQIGGLNDAFEGLLNKLLQKNDKKRPTATQLMQLLRKITTS